MHTHTLTIETIYYHEMDVDAHFRYARYSYNVSPLTSSSTAENLASVSIFPSYFLLKPELIFIHFIILLSCNIALLHIALLA